MTVEGTRFGFVSVGFRILAQGIVSQTPVDVGIAIVRVKLYGLVVVLDCM